MARARILIPLLVGILLLASGCFVFAAGDPSDTAAYPDLDAMATVHGGPWNQALMPMFEQAAEKHGVPLPLLLTLGYFGSAFENRGDAPTIENGFGVMALREKNFWKSDTLGEGEALTKVPRGQLKTNPRANIEAAAAVLSAYANQMGIDRSGGLDAWLNVVIKYAGLDEEYSRMFAMEVYTKLSAGLDWKNSDGERFQFDPQNIGSVDLASLEPKSARRVYPGQSDSSAQSGASAQSGTSKDLAFANPFRPGTGISTDAGYGGATWYPAASCNYSTAQYNKTTGVVHTIEGSASGALSWFQNCSAQVSSHYVVSEAGGVWQCVDEIYTAWHVGCANSYCIGVEHEGYASSSSHPQALYDASGLLFRDFCNRWGIPKQHNGCPPGILGHIDINNCVCGPGHTDPGNGWDWNYFINAVNGGVPLNSAFNAQSYQATMVAGSTAIVWVEYQNTGTTTWEKGGSNPVHLGTWNPQDRNSAFYTPGNWINAARPTDMDISTCAPGGIARFTFIMTAPSTPGVYTEYWRLVKEGVAWFGYDGVWFQVTVTAPQNNAAYVSDTIPASIQAGQTTTVNITFQNTGDTTWTAANGYKLGAVGDSDPFAATRQLLADTDSIAPGQQKTWAVPFTAPTTPGTYTTDWRMVREGVEWFGGTLSKSVTVTSADTTPPSVPTGLTAAAQSTSQVNISWTASTDNVGVTGYKIYRNGAYLTSVTGTSYSNTGLAMGTTYSYTVSAYDAAGNNSAQSAAADDSTWIIVDNADAGFTASANWSTGTSSTDKYGTNYRYRSTAAVSDAANWNFNIPTADTYQVYAWWPQGTNRSTTAPYIVYYNGGNQTVSVNQQVNGGTWNSLGTWNFAAGSNNVKLSCWTTAGYVVMADAIRLIRR